MNNWKHYAGSILLAGLLLQGCSDTPTDATVAKADQGTTTLEKFNASSSFFSDDTVDPAAQDQAKEELTLKMNTLNASDADMQAFVAKIMNEYSLSKPQALEAIAAAITGSDRTATPSSSRAASRSFLSGITDKIKDALVDVMDSSLGNKITSAAFDVVLNSDGVTLVMLDLARQSDTIAQIMLDAIGADWSLVKKMAPMLRDEDPEFSEKFTALAYEYEPMGKFFFANINRTDGGVELGLMYDALTDAMLNSNDESAYGDYSGDQGGAIEHSTTGYMGLLMERYAVDFFINPANGVATKYGNTNAFASLMMNTGAVIPDNNASINHGDAMELTNEQFFYAMFVTPASTDSFVVAMEAVQENDAATATMFMDNIFLGQGATQTDSIQGSYNIIAIGTGMYEGLFGNTSHAGYGLTAYTNAFIGFAGLIPTDRYIPYAMAFMDAGYMYAGQVDLDLWETAKEAFTDLTSPAPAPSYAGAPSRSAGLGTISSDWTDDVIDLFLSGWGQVSFGDLTSALLSEDQSIIDELNQQAMAAYRTVVDGRNADGTINPDYATTITNPTLPEWINNDTVYGFHGLLELAMQEDIFYVNCGSTATDYLVSGYTCENNASYTMENAKDAFTLPTFANITWNYAYTAASEGVVAYWNNTVNVKWLADLSTNQFVQDYFYPSENGLVASYVPSWMLSIDWLKLPNAVNETTYNSIDLSFDGGYVDVYFVSTLDNLADINGAVPIEMVDDSMLAQDANNDLVATRYVYKIRAINPQQVADALAYLQGIGEGLIGLDATNAAQTPAP